MNKDKWISNTNNRSIKVIVIMAFYFIAAFMASLIC